MKNIIHFSTHDSGGAGSAALRFHKICENNNYKSLMFCNNKKTNNNNVLQLNSKWKSFYFRVLNKIDNILNLFNSKYYFIDKKRNIITRVNDIVNKLPFHPDVIFLYWISGFIDLKVIKLLQKKYNCKIYWYLMDMAPMTGGCHYAWDCEGYKSDCLFCPAVRFPYLTKPFNILAKKKQIIEDLNIETISGTSWLKNQLSQSTLFKSINYHEIMIGINKDIFKPLDEKDILKIKQKYNLPNNKKILFFGASSTIEERKGFTFLIKALEVLSLDMSFDNNSIVLVTAGTLVDDKIFKSITIEHIHIGFLSGDKELASAYQIAYLFVSPSIEDSGPMMINESIMCGTPVVSFNMGVAFDLIITDETGYLVKLKDIYDLANGIKKLVNLDLDKYIIMKKNCRNMGLSKYAEIVQINKIKELLEE